MLPLFWEAVPSPFRVFNKTSIPCAPPIVEAGCSCDPALGPCSGTCRFLRVSFFPQAFRWDSLLSICLSFAQRTHWHRNQHRHRSCFRKRARRAKGGVVPSPSWRPTAPATLCVVPRIGAALTMTSGATVRARAVVSFVSSWCVYRESSRGHHLRPGSKVQGVGILECSHIGTEICTCRRVRYSPPCA